MKIKVERKRLVQLVQVFEVDSERVAGLNANHWEFDQRVCDFGEVIEEQHIALDNDDLEWRVMERTTVIRIEDDRDVPLTGLIMGWEDDERVHIAWGDSKYADNPWDETHIEYADGLTPYGKPR